LAYFLSSVLWFSGALGVQNKCEPLLGECNYYLCRNIETPCKENNYLKDFGYKYCVKYRDQVAKKMSDKGKKWLSHNAYCLQAVIDNLNIKTNNKKSCAEFKRHAIETHSDCYLATGFCDLSPSDQQHVIIAAWSTIFKNEFRKEISELLELCR
jgi:hypothetical protein